MVFNRVGPIYLADTDTDISVSAIWISVLSIQVLVLVSATLDIGYIGIGQISAKIHGYRPIYRPKYQLSAENRPK